MIQGPPSLGSKLVLVLFLPSECKDHIKSLYGNLFFFWLGVGVGAKTPGLTFLAEVGVATAGCHFRMQRREKLASEPRTRESALTDRAR